MSNTYKFSVQNFYRSAKPVDGKDGVITAINWRFDAKDDNDPPNTYFSSGTVQCAKPGDDFVPYEKVTEDIACGWACAAIGKEQIAALEKAADAHIASLVEPEVISTKPLWVVKAEEEAAAKAAEEAEAKRTEEVE